MLIQLENLTKRFNQERVFENINYTFELGNHYAITGSNGSGKSTLIQVIAGGSLPSAGIVKYSKGVQDIPVEEVFKEVSLAAPYLDIIQEFTLIELLEFHFKFKNLISGKTITDIIEDAYFIGSENKYIKNFSSGMKQRLKLVLAFYSDTPILLLDEPTSNLDEKAISWYATKINQIDNRLVIIASNQPEEYKSCKSVLNIESFK
ncbi:ABC transporter ATP-binding protein [Fulvivirga lutimaris]|uniref:ABC transporter ATP-binding protein n=1 Tax=Fulvivirga lutimaris TaxID=1819566 RepID=UPI0012BCA24E|nr:ATP-binding cassette domain-containing protein [Fulvivirga lutimaris]MTI38616.1 ATP-binding cassette domain-containing protein [Fulvivirga lutimaris]